MSHRALLSVAALTLADFFLWHWSLDGNHEILALVSGLTLPPLGVAFVWVLVVNLARLFATGARRPAAQLKVRGSRAARSVVRAPHVSHRPRRRPATAPPGAHGEPPRKIAA